MNKKNKKYNTNKKNTTKNTEKKQLENEVENTVTKEDDITANVNDTPSITDFMGNTKDIFSTNKQKYENTMSSAIILLFFGCVGLFIELLAVIGIIYLPILSFQYILMFLVFGFFVASGYFSYKKANSYKNAMQDEENQRNKVDYFLNDLLTDKYLNELKSDELSEEENYILIIDKLCSMILEKYPEYNKDLLEYMIDDYLNEHF